MTGTRKPSADASMRSILPLMGTDKSVTERLCRVAANLRPIKHKYASTPVLALMHTLIEQSGYLQHPDALEREAIMDVLREYPELVHEWWIWSGDQRSVPGWCFDEDQGQYRVYHYPNGESLIFNDRTVACSEYILRVIPWVEAVTAAIVADGRAK